MLCRKGNNYNPLLYACSRCLPIAHVGDTASSHCAIVGVDTPTNHHPNSIDPQYHTPPDYHHAQGTSTSTEGFSPDSCVQHDVSCRRQGHGTHGNRKQSHWATEGESRSVGYGQGSCPHGIWTQERMQRAAANAGGGFLYGWRKWRRKYTHRCHNEYLNIPPGLNSA